MPFYSSEQYFMWQKAKLFKDEVIANRVLTSKDLIMAKMLGRKVKNFDKEVWNDHKENFMINSLRHKFTATPKLTEKIVKFSRNSNFVEPPHLIKYGGNRT